MKMDENGKVRFEGRREISNVEGVLRSACKQLKLDDEEKRDAEALADILETMWYSW